MLPTDDTVAMPDSSEINTEYVEEVGALVFESALVRFFADASIEETTMFEAYIAEHAADETFMADLCATFPEFEKLILAELEALGEDLGSVFPTTTN